MLKLILKNLLARRVRNAWLLAELILVTVLTWYITDPLFVLSYNQPLPQRLTEQKTYQFPFPNSLL